VADLLSHLGNKNFIVFGGKGGSGKTTSACAAALRLAQLHREKNVLVVSTDPAHSLGDSFQTEIGNSIVAIKGVDNLWAFEMDAMDVYKKWNEKYGDTIKKIADRGTNFDEQDIEDFFSLTIPGLDEMMAIIKLIDIQKEDKYDLIILDTAPTGHTLRLLNLPKDLARMVNLMNMMMLKHRYICRTFTGRYKKDECDDFIEMMGRDLKKVKMLFKNEQTTEFIPVTIPEPMYFNETNRLLKQLKKLQVPVRNAIINCIVTSRNGKCSFCSSRRKFQKGVLKQFNEEFASYNLCKIPLFPYEIRGLDKLEEYAEVLFGGTPRCWIPQRVSFLSKPEPASFPQMKELLEKDFKFMMFGGKGGVGKTTLAAATALRLARMQPDKNILVFSTDPAHSLADAFESSIGDEVRTVNGMKNLYGYEIDAGKKLEEWKKNQLEHIREFFDTFMGTGIDLKFDREVMEELISVPPPGIDEIMALGDIADFVEEKRFDKYILDSAATGHLIRLLEMPQLMREWMNTIFKILLKYRKIMRMNKMAQDLIEDSRRLRRVQKVLTDPQRTAFIAVSIPEGMAQDETNRLLMSLDRLNIPCHNLVVNMVVPLTNCGFCSLKRKGQQEYINRFKREKKYSQYQIGELPLLSEKLKGMEGLTKIGTILYG